MIGRSATHGSWSDIGCCCFFGRIINLLRRCLGFGSGRRFGSDNGGAHGVALASCLLVTPFLVPIIVTFREVIAPPTAFRAFSAPMFRTTATKTSSGLALFRWRAINLEFGLPRSIRLTITIETLSWSNDLLRNLDNLRGRLSDVDIHRESGRCLLP